MNIFKRGITRFVLNALITKFDISVSPLNYTTNDLSLLGC